MLLVAIAFIVLLLMGMPVAFAIGISGALFFTLHPELPFTIPVQVTVSQTQKFALLAVPLRSYLQPIIIMAVIPFGIVGAIFGHRLMRELAPALGNLSMMSVFGVVALSGVVVNASLVLVHYINERRAQGLALERAVREAGVARFRPMRRPSPRST